MIKPAAPRLRALLDLTRHWDWHEPTRARLRLNLEILERASTTSPQVRRSLREIRKLLSNPMGSLDEWIEVESAKRSGMKGGQIAASRDQVKGVVEELLAAIDLALKDPGMR